ncbi:MAG: DUF1704 domain-containing protein [Deltaproteobacteria bacterium]|nr:DUF1704 domain-containing protein [Deltaproteobacteria bacterium]
METEEENDPGACAAELDALSSRAPANDGPGAGPGEGPGEGPGAPPVGAARERDARLARVAARSLEAQRPLRVLSALQWDRAVWERFRREGFRELPSVDAETYRAMALGFDPQARARDFEDLTREVRQGFAGDPLAEVLARTCEDYAGTCHMLAARGTRAFYGWSRRLYGSPKDRLPEGCRVGDVARSFQQRVALLDEGTLGTLSPRVLDGAQVAAALRRRFRRYFGGDPVAVVLDDSLVADAAAGSDYVKIRASARFSPRDVDILEVHEGWVHVATSLNGAAQPVARWLAKGPPRTTAVQEGLASLMEVLTLRSHPRRARRLNERVLAVDHAEEGGDFLEVFEWYRARGYEAEDCYNGARRVFRGGVLTGGAPFTKDIAYTRGFVDNWRFLRDALRQGRPEQVRNLFVGKVAHEDVAVLTECITEGRVNPPRFVPRVVSDLNGLAIWVANTEVLGARPTPSDPAAPRPRANPRAEPTS